MNMMRAVLLFVSGLVVGLGLMVTLLQNWPLWRNSGGDSLACVDNLALAYRSLPHENREYAHVDLSLSEADVVFRLYFIGTICATNAEGAQRFLGRLNANMGRLPGSIRERVVVLTVAPNVPFSVLRDSLDSIANTGFEHVWVEDVGLLRFGDADAKVWRRESGVREPEPRAAKGAAVER